MAWLMMLAASPPPHQTIPALRDTQLDVPIWVLYIGCLISLLVAAIMIWRCNASGRCGKSERHHSSLHQ